jgi:GTPase SAR1 family protein
MVKYAQIVIGPAGCGKSTYCDTLHTHLTNIGRSVHMVNMDPAAEQFHYPVSLDIRDLVTLDDVMKELQLGPNGGLLACMEYLEENLEEWLGEELQSYTDDDYLIFDCPGQIELYTHLGTFKAFVDYLKRDGWTLVAVYCIDCHFVSDASKFISGAMQALAAMVKLELPHVNVLTKMDICPDESKKQLDDFLFPDPTLLLNRLTMTTGPRFRALNKAVVSLLDEFSLVNFVPLNIADEDSIAEVLYAVDLSIHYGEDADVKMRDEPEGEGMEEGEGE